MCQPGWVHPRATTSGVSYDKTTLTQKQQVCMAITGNAGCDYASGFSTCPLPRLYCKLKGISTSMSAFITCSINHIFSIDLPFDSFALI
jgi:hypothetical protein